MRRIGLLACTLLLALALAACNGNGAEETPAPGTTPQQTPPPAANGPAAEGEAIFTGQTAAAQPFCSSCHSVGQGDRVGPDLQGIATRGAERVAGLTAEEYIRQSIVDPNAYNVEGFAPAMPTNYDDQLSDEQLNALVAYLMTLR